SGQVGMSIPVTALGEGNSALYDAAGQLSGPVSWRTRSLRARAVAAPTRSCIRRVSADAGRPVWVQCSALIWRARLISSPSSLRLTGADESRGWTLAVAGRFAGPELELGIGPFCALR